MMHTDTSAHETINSNLHVGDNPPDRSLYPELHELWVSIAVVDQSTYVQHRSAWTEPRTTGPKTRTALSS